MLESLRTIIEISMKIVWYGIDVVMLIFAGWTFWHGVEIKTGGIEIVLNGVGRFFKK